MKQFTVDPSDSETASQLLADRGTELATQGWSREKSAAMAQDEGVELNDGHWAVVTFLRGYYLEYGLPIAARTTAGALKRHFAKQGGKKYLYQLFPGGPVSQGSRFANVRTPAYATDPSFGTSY